MKRKTWRFMTSTVGLFFYPKTNLQIYIIIDTKIHCGCIWEIPFHPIISRRYYAMSTSYDDIYAFIQQQQAVAKELQQQLNSFYGKHPYLLIV